jgi:hypothetical protein
MLGKRRGAAHSCHQGRAHAFLRLRSNRFPARATGGTDHRFVLNRAYAVFYARPVSSEEQSMQKLTLIAALALGIAASPALACDWNKEAKTETQTIVSEQSADEATAQQEARGAAPTQHVEDGGTVVADGALH